MPLATSHCDVCSVSRDPAGIVLQFGERGTSAHDPRAVAVTLRHRVVIDEGAATQLHDLMAALLAEYSQAAENTK